LKIHHVLGCEVLYDDATGGLCKKYLRARMHMSEETLKKKMSPLQAVPSTVSIWV